MVGIVSRAVMLALLAALPITASASASETCVAAGSQPLVEARVTSGSPRVYFRSDIAKIEHYVDMHVDGGRAWAVLPRIADATRAIEYRITVPKGHGAALISTGRIVVAEGCSAPDLQGQEAEAATTIVVGSTVEGPALPPGFLCDGVVGQIDSVGQLRAYLPCRDALMRASVDDESIATSDFRPVVSTISKRRPDSPSSDDFLTPGTNFLLHPAFRRGNPFGNNPPPPHPRVDHPVSHGRP